ncbi:MAG: molybdenum cofactor guanylyltransferase [Syntrophorhabdaceae bacterium]|nr:molybdenum cofactor guanylyltransferase [Syntrophorhabdaceae bacterium]
MGRDKATAGFQGGTLIETVFDTVKMVFDDITIVSSMHDSLGGIDVPVVDDIIPVQTPMVGIATALLHSTKQRVFVVACDMPLVSRESIECLIGAPGNAEITIPMVGQYYEPLHAVYSRSCLPHFLRLIGFHRLKISGVFPYVTMNVIRDDPCFRNARGDLVFMNVNTAEELQRANTDPS